MILLRLWVQSQRTPIGVCGFRVAPEPLTGDSQIEPGGGIRKAIGRGALQILHRLIILIGRQGIVAKSEFFVVRATPTGTHRR